MRRVCRALLVDVDNTLYTRKSGIGLVMGHRIIEFIKGQMDEDEAHKLSAEIIKKFDLDEGVSSDIISYSESEPCAYKRFSLSMYQAYGLSVNGLRLHVWPKNKTEDEIQQLTMDYLHYVHEPSKDLGKYVPKNPELKKMLQSVTTTGKKKLYKYMFTNAYNEHANRIAQHLEVHTLFDGMYEYLEMMHECKPFPKSYHNMLAIVNRNVEKLGDKPISFAECAFLDDNLHNLRSAKQLGITTILIGSTFSYNFSSVKFGDAAEIAKVRSYVDCAYPEITDFFRDPEALAHLNLSITAV